jgi:hypothetical protein
VTCSKAPTLQKYYPLLQAMGHDAMSDEEPDPDQVKMVSEASCRLLRYIPRYRSSQCTAFVRLLDDLEYIHETCPLTKGSKKKKKKNASSMVTPTGKREYRDSEKFSDRDPGINRPMQLFSKSFLKTLEEEYSYKFQTSDQFKDLTWPTSLPAKTLAKLNLTSDALAAKFK